MRTLLKQTFVILDRPGAGGNLAAEHVAQSAPDGHTLPMGNNSILPDVPTVAEQGLPGFEATTWHGLVAPSRTPAAVIETLHKATVQVLADPDVVKSLTNLGVDITPSTPAEFERYIAAEIPKWTAIVKASGAKIE